MVASPETKSLSQEYNAIFGCKNPQCLNGQGERSFESAYFLRRDTIPETIPCTSCGQQMVRVATVDIKG